MGPIKEEEVTASNDTPRDTTEHHVADASVREKAVIREGGVRGQGGGRGQGKEAINGMPSKKSNSTSQLSAEGLFLLLLCSSLREVVCYAARDEIASSKLETVGW